ncbi:MAG: hypothetical protein OXH63_13570, partial [Gemmatimonadetes bacterium]|nr:hypothetical protein [Gemmatimonadota bacterium]
EQLKIDDLPPGRLMWVLGNGMQLRPDFTIRVNDEDVKSKLDKGAAVTWDFGSPEVQDAINNRWAENDDEERRIPIANSGGAKGLDPAHPQKTVPYVDFAHLGRVWGLVRLFDDTLLSHRSADHGRSHGFFLLVRGRLVNPDDEKLYASDPSFQTFYRSQFVINADQLDESLLADRQRLRQDEAIRELSLLQRALLGMARVTIEARDDQRDEEQTTRSILPVASRMYYRDPINALLARVPVEDARDFDPAGVGVERRPLGSDQPLSVVAFDAGAFHVNSSHPYYAALQSRAGQSRAAREFLRAFDLFAISERLLEGHLLELGISDEAVTEIVQWREGLFKRLALSYEAAPELIQEMHRTSYTGGEAFELSLAKVFGDMGFTAMHDGASGKKDVLVLAAVGREGYRFTIEAKGSNGSVSNDAAAVGAAASHRDAAGAEHALIVARTFAGFGPARDQECAVLDECRSTGGVSVIELDAVERMHASIAKYSYPLVQIKDVVCTLETPAHKISRIEGLEKPAKDFDYPTLLDQIWSRQNHEALDDLVPYRSVFQQEGWRDTMDMDDFARRLVALETLAAGRIQLKRQAELVGLRQAPELILEQMHKTLEGLGHNVG